MARGTAILLTNFKSVTSCEFNGNMSIGHNTDGSFLLEHLEKAKTVREFKRAIEKFNGGWYGYDNIPLHLTVGKLRNIRFKQSTYFRDWFSDYLTFLSIAWFKIKITCINGDVFYLMPGEIAVFYFGNFFMSHNYQYNQFAYVPLKTPKPVYAEQPKNS
jgi:hypothetical protein